MKILITIVIVFFMCYYEYSCITKYFPKMTMWEYLFLGDKIRIIPHGND